MSAKISREARVLAFEDLWPPLKVGKAFSGESLHMEL